MQQRAHTVGGTENRSGVRNRSPQNCPRNKRNSLVQDRAEIASSGHCGQPIGDNKTERSLELRIVVLHSLVGVSISLLLHQHHDEYRRELLHGSHRAGQTYFEAARTVYIVYRCRLVSRWVNRQPFLTCHPVTTVTSTRCTLWS
jgi:hypothetical protein